MHLTDRREETDWVAQSAYGHELANYLCLPAKHSLEDWASSSRRAADLKQTPSLSHTHTIESGPVPMAEKHEHDARSGFYWTQENMLVEAVKDIKVKKL